MVERPATTAPRRRTVAKGLVLLGAAAVIVNAIMLADGGGSPAPQVVNIVLGSLLLIAGGRILKARA